MSSLKLILLACVSVFSAYTVAQTPVAKGVKIKRMVASNNSFVCSNQPTSTWKQYYAVMGSYNSKNEIYNVTYGTFEGSVQAAEMEPVEVFEFTSLKHQPSLKASSSEWAKALAFDVTTQSLGNAVFYIHENAFSGGQKDVRARLKIQVAGKTQNIRLDCGGF